MAGYGERRQSWQGSGNKVQEVVQQVFQALDVDNSGTVSVRFLIDFLERNGLERCDPRMKHMHYSLNKWGMDYKMTLDDFNKAVKECCALVHKCAVGNLRCPDFNTIREIIKATYEKVLPCKSGQNAQYIPQLAQVDPEQFAISLTTTDGQHFSIGDADTQYCIQSESKPISYLLALDKFGEDYVHNHVGTEPSGRPFNEMVLKASPTPENLGRAIPHNPCINAGAIMTVSMVSPDVPDMKMRHQTVLEAWRDLSAADMMPEDPIGYDEDTYKSESSCANRNWCLAYMMMEKGAFPPCFYRHKKDLQNITDTLELYFQLCSILSTNRAMSVMAATLANGGLNPWSEKVVCSAENVRCVLPVMLASGMYDYSGQWAYEVGMPAKSGVGGGVFMVVPNICGISVWSPRLNEEGNSWRGVEVASELVKHLQVHGFEVFAGVGKLDPTKRKHEDKDKQLNELLFAASLGDANSIKKFHQMGVDLFEGDYDTRTSLHLAATEGHAECLQFLVDCIPADRKQTLLNKQDRWKGTPLDDAEDNGHSACVDILKASGASKGRRPSKTKASLPPAASRKATPSEEGPELICSAARGDLDRLVQLRTKGIDLSHDHHDYDLRTPLQLAASNGQLDCVKYMVAQAQKIGRPEIILKAVDRFGHTALDDAVREGKKECEDFLRQAEQML